MKLFTMMVLILCSQFCYAQTVVVVSKDSQIEALDDQYVANIFLARTSRFPNGEKAQPIELKNSDLRTHFYQEISGKTPRQLNAYWTTLVFTGKGKPPRRYANTDDLQAKLLAQSGSITYLSLDEVTDEMKIVYRFP